MTEPQQGASYADLRAVARATATGGFSAFFRSDHVLSMGESSGLPGPSESFVTLGALAAELPDIRLGTMVTSATFRHPGMLALAAATVDDISGGRLELGLGAGWYEAEHTAYGLPFGASFGERFDRLTEQLEILSGLWATPVGAVFDHRGEHYQLAGAPGLPKPVQRSAEGTPHIPLIVGGHGPRRTPALAARFADEFNVGFSDADTVGAQIARVRAACEAAGRNPDELTYSSARPICCATDAADLGRRASVLGIDLSDPPADGLVGTPEQVLEQLAGLAAVGVQRMYLQVIDLADLDHLALVADQVRVPALDL